MGGVENQVERAIYKGTVVGAIQKEKEITPR